MAQRQGDGAAGLAGATAAKGGGGDAGARAGVLQAAARVRPKLNEERPVRVVITDASLPRPRTGATTPRVRTPAHP